MMIDFSFLETNFTGECSISGVLLIRHAEREIITTMESQQSIPLTENGIQDSERFGDALKISKRNILGLKSSPVNRCVKTIESIAMAAGLNTAINLSTNLGDPGPFIHDDILAREAFTERSLIELVNMQISGIQFPGIRPISEGCGLILREIVGDLSTDVGIHIYVSHDAVLCPLIGYLMEMSFKANGWIDYLNGAVFFKKENRFYLQWLGKAYDITYTVRSLIHDE